jgi:lysine 2,3-aminomutase
MRREVLRDFRMGITPYYLALVDPEDADDPILRQIAPIVEEYIFRDVGDEDPLAEEQYSPVPGITHRYPDRVLMVISNSCAIYCRYCTRKRIMYEDAVPDVEIDRMVDYIARTKAVRDVIVSGGDPLTYGTKKLESILAKLRAIPHLEIIRIGSRVPVSIPQRIDAELCEMLARYHPLWINVHFNHPRELTAEAAAACDRLSRAGIPLNNQAVLLKGVNDDVETIRQLCTGLMKMRVRPYYLYQCDPIRGGEHFRTPIAKGIEIMEGLRGHTSGLAIPTYVVDAPGGGGKIPVGPNYLLHHDPRRKRAVLRNYQGRLFEYLEPTGRAGPMTSKARRGGGELKPIAPRASGRASANPVNANGPGSTHGKSKRAAGKSGWVHRGRSLDERLGSQPKS